MLYSWRHAKITSTCDGPAHPAAAASEPPASPSAGLFGRATVPKSATVVLSHSVPVATAELHQFEFLSDIGVRVSPLQAVPDQFKFSLVTSVTVRVHVRVGALTVV